jgi:cation diffusion facilitator family transporter
MRRRAMIVSLLVSFLMLAGKVGAAYMTGSAAIFSDAVESVIHLFATAFAGFSLWYAATPPDTNHLYGHGKIAYFASGFEGGLILVAALSIIYSAVHDLLVGPELQQLGAGLVVIAALSVVNAGLGWYLIRTGRQHNSLVLVSNGQHVMTDMWTSVGVVGGVGLVWLTDIVWLDPVVAILVACNILWTAGRLIRRSARGLMERADTEATERILDTLNRAMEHELIENFHQVRHRRVNDQVWVEYHLLFPEDMSITEAHDRSHLVEDAVNRLFPKDDVHVTAHLEPVAHDTYHPEDHQEPTDPLRSFEPSS